MKLPLWSYLKIEFCVFQTVQHDAVPLSSRYNPNANAYIFLEEWLLNQLNGTRVIGGYLFTVLSSSTSSSQQEIESNRRKRDSEFLLKGRRS